MPAGPTGRTQGVRLSDTWCTEKALCDALGEFDLDPCSNPRSQVKATVSYMLERNENGLELPWHGSVYCNPPYSDVMPWAERLIAHDDSWVALLKLDPTTAWFKTLANHANWRPFRRRIKFERPDKPPLTANFPSVLFWRGRSHVIDLPAYWLLTRTEMPWL